MAKATQNAMPVPTESVEQRLLFQWAKMNLGKYPAMALMYHIPNGGRRGKGEAGRFKAEGVKAGVPDIFLPAPRGQYHGLYIELKRIRGGRIEPEQLIWMEALTKQGYCCAVCKGHEAAIKVILDYLEGKDMGLCLAPRTKTTLGNFLCLLRLPATLL